MFDSLGSARARRETYVGEWLPEPIATAPDTDPEGVSMAFLVLLERLSPSERAAFLLAEVFDDSFAEVAVTLGKTEDACRQLAARARRHVEDARRRLIDRAAHERVLGAFLNACATSDVAANASRRVTAPSQRRGAERTVTASGRSAGPMHKGRGTGAHCRHVKRGTLSVVADEFLLE